MDVLQELLFLLVLTIKYHCLYLWGVYIVRYSLICLSLIVVDNFISSHAYFIMIFMFSTYSYIIFDKFFREIWQLNTYLYFYLCLSLIYVVFCLDHLFMFWKRVLYLTFSQILAILYPLLCKTEITAKNH